MRSNIFSNCSVFIINYNEREKLKVSTSIWKKLKGKGIVEEVTVFDNNSSDGSTEFLQSTHPSINIVESSENLGWGVAVNSCLRKANERFLFLSTPDMLVNENWCTSLLSHLENNPTAAISTGIVINPSGKVVGRGLRQNVWFRFPPASPSSSPRSVDAARGSAILARRQACIDVGGVDSDLFIQGGDINLCMKLSDNGWDISFVPGALSWHYDDGANDLFYYNSRNCYILISRHLGYLQAIPAILYNIAYHSIVVTLMYIFGKVSASDFLDNWRGLRDGFKKVLAEKGFV